MRIDFADAIKRRERPSKIPKAEKGRIFAGNARALLKLDG